MTTPSTGDAGATAGAMKPLDCRWCGMVHGVRCPSVKAIEYHQDGSVKRVEFLTGVDYPPIAAGQISPNIALVGGWFK